MPKKTKKHKKSNITLTIIIGIVIAYIVVMTVIPMSNLLMLIISKATLSLAVLYFTWFYKTKPSVYEKCFLTAYSLVPWLIFVVNSYRLVLLLEIIIMYFLIFKILINYLKKKQNLIVTEIVAAISLLACLFTMKTITYKFNDGLCLYKVSLCISVAALAITIVLIERQKITFSKCHRLYKFLTVMGVFIVCFVICWSTENVLNYCLDTSKPESSVSIIQDKKLVTGTKGKRDYSLYSIIDGEKMKFNVSKSEYENKEIGDFIFLELYEGAFGEPYYICN